MIVLRKGVIHVVEEKIADQLQRPMPILRPTLLDIRGLVVVDICTVPEQVHLRNCLRCDRSESVSGHYWGGRGVTPVSSFLAVR